MAKKTGNNNNNNNNNKNDDDNDDTRYEFSLPLHETLGWALFTWRRSLTNLGEKLLSAYASQKYSMERNDGVFYTTSSKLINPTLTTDKRLSNMVIITFEAIFKASNNNDCLIYERPEKMLKEKEYRRYVDDSHPLLIQKLGGHGCNDLSNMKFHSREIHIYFNNYRLMINVKDDTFYIQYKKFIEKKECFLAPTLTREILYTSDEGPAYTEPRFIVSKRGKTIIGVASFLDCRNFCVKTIYAKYKESICLYQRVQPDDFSKSYPFVLECELDHHGNDDDDIIINDEEKKLILYKFFDIGCQLDATVSKRKNHYGCGGGGGDNNNNDGLLNHSLAVSSKPVHKATIPRGKNGGGFFFPKFDGVPATLIFFPHHFIIRNAIKSESFEHSLPRKIYYILKDYKFLVESDLYVSKYKKEENLCQNRPNPLVIIDIQTTAFNAEKRMSIIQILRNCLAKFLYEYFIFFQGEDCDGVLTATATTTTPKAAVAVGDGGKEDEEEEEEKDKEEKYENDDEDGEEKEKEELNIIKKKKKRDNKDDLSLLLSKGVIYEVKLSLGNKRIINKVIKPRRDKFKANSSKMVDLIWKIQTTQTQI